MRCDFRSITCGAVIAAVIAASPPDAAAKPKENTDVQALLKALEKQAQRIEKSERAVMEQQRKVSAERAEFEALKAKVQSLTGVNMKSSGQPQETAQERPLTPAVPSVSNPNAPIPAEVGTDRKQAQPEKPPEVAKFIEEGGVLLPKGRLEIAPSFEYNRVSATTVAIQGFSIVPALNIGSFDISQINRDVAIGAVSARLGITNRLEVDAKIPYVYGKQSTIGRAVGVGASENTTNNIGGSGIGDVEVGAHYQINKGENGWPYFVGNLRYKSTTGSSPFEKAPDAFGLQTDLATGSGFTAFQPSVTMILPSDPVVFYSNWGYVFNLSNSYPNYGDIDPGDAITTSFGLSLALNDAASMSFGYSHTMVLRTLLNDEPLSGSRELQVGSLDIGYSYALDDWIGLNVSVSAGLTSDAPDERLIFRVPMSFSMF